MTIHDDHPFADPADDPVRRLRGRLGGAVTLWTSPGERPAGLTVSSVMVAAGEPASVVALLDPDSDLAESLTSTGLAVVHLLSWEHRELAEQFAGLFPAPGGVFTQADFESTDWGPRLVSAPTWAGVRLQDARDVGWSSLVTCTLEHVSVGADDEPLVHRRGRFSRG